MTISDEAVEAAAIALLERDYGVRDWSIVTEQVRGNYLDEARAALEAAAPSLTKFRAVTTEEELDALPLDSIILDSDPDALLNVKGGWLSVRDFEGIPYKTASVSLPAIVLHEPEATE